MATYNEKAIHLAVLSIGVDVIFIASFALYAHPDFTNAHWDVIQDEATQEQSKGFPLFGDKFPNPSENE